MITGNKLSVAGGQSSLNSETLINMSREQSVIKATGYLIRGSNQESAPASPDEEKHDRFIQKKIEEAEEADSFMESLKGKIKKKFGDNSMEKFESFEEAEIQNQFYTEKEKDNIREESGGGKTLQNPHHRSSIPEKGLPPLHSSSLLFNNKPSLLSVDPPGSLAIRRKNESGTNHRKRFGNLPIKAETGGARRESNGRGSSLFNTTTAPKGTTTHGNQSKSKNSNSLYPSESVIEIPEHSEAEEQKICKFFTKASFSINSKLASAKSQFINQRSSDQSLKVDFDERIIQPAPSDVVWLNEKCTICRMDKPPKSLELEQAITGIKKMRKTTTTDLDLIIPCVCYQVCHRKCIKYEIIKEKKGSCPICKGIYLTKLFSSEKCSLIWKINIFLLFFTFTILLFFNISGFIYSIFSDGYQLFCLFFILALLVQWTFLVIVTIYRRKKRQKEIKALKKFNFFVICKLNEANMACAFSFKRFSELLDRIVQAERVQNCLKNFFESVQKENEKEKEFAKKSKLTQVFRRPGVDLNEFGTEEKIISFIDKENAQVMDSQEENLDEDSAYSNLLSPWEFKETVVKISPGEKFKKPKLGPEN